MFVLYIKMQKITVFMAEKEDEVRQKQINGDEGEKTEERGDEKKDGKL